ncbi:MAG: Flp pilus assembly complex ATPase component TadA [Labilithrix sp.]|nr:Flp pilus assembly complex ATPase component TadA [Labilithrix sp.]MCW5813860.1 Flp pilus assembly complex ATPase component TadA [Labilithrix sp.]
MANIDPILDELVKRGGTDLHLAVNQPPLGRVRGEIAPLRDQPVTAKELEEMLLELVTPAQRQRLAADLDLDLAIQFKDVARFRASYYVKHSGIAASFRLVPARVPSLTELGLPEVVWRLADRRSGLVVVAGPACAGKTTTTAAMVDHVNKTRPCHVLTLENPIEFVHESLRAQITQREIGTHVPTFASALRSAPRENPDVLVVSDLPSTEDVEPVLKLASDGVLVLLTVPASGSAGALQRILAGVSPERHPRLQSLLADCLAGVVVQHLLPGAGGKPRVAAHEVLVANAAISAIVRDGKYTRVAEALVAGSPQGMQTLDADLERHLGSGAISAETALDRALDKEAFAEVVRRTRPDLVD